MRESVYTDSLMEFYEVAMIGLMICVSDRIAITWNIAGTIGTYGSDSRSTQNVR